MKKVILSAFALVSFCAVNAQTAPFGQKTQQLGVNIQVDDVITMSSSNSSLSTTVGAAAQHSANGAYLYGNNTGMNNEFKVQSNRYYNVTVKLDNITYTGTKGYAGNNINWASTDVRYKLLSANNTTGGTPAGAVNTYLPFTAFNTEIPVLNNCPNTVGAGATDGSSLPNTGKTFAMNFHVRPDWQYAGGLYQTQITVTATQE